LRVVILTPPKGAKGFQPIDATKRAPVLSFNPGHRDHGRQAAGKKAALQRVVSMIGDSCRKQQSKEEATWQ